MPHTKKPSKWKAPANVTELYARCATGDRLARDALILAHVGLAPEIADAFVKKHYDVAHLRDDCECEVLFAFTRKCDRWTKPHKPALNPTKQLRTVAWRSLLKLADRDPLIHPSKTQCDRIRAAQKKDGVKPTDERKLPIPKIEHAEALEHVPEKTLPDMQEPDEQPGERSEKLRALIDECCQSTFETRIVARRADGLTIRAVASELGYGKTYVGKTLDGILHRAKERHAETLETLAS